MESKTEESTLLNDEYSTQLTSSCNTMPPENTEMSDAIRISSDHPPIIGENVTIREKDVSVGSPNISSTVLPQSYTSVPKPETPKQKSPPILETPIPAEKAHIKNRPQTLFKLSLTKSKEDVFVKPSPVAEIMSPAKMLQFEIDLTYSSTPTMKRAAIDFNFLKENNFEEYFTDVPKNAVSASADAESGTFIETPVIVKADTVRHEIGYGEIRDASFDRNLWLFTFELYLRFALSKYMLRLQNHYTLFCIQFSKIDIYELTVSKSNKFI